MTVGAELSSGKIQKNFAFKTGVEAVDENTAGHGSENVRA
jgi:hypothetical protein